MLLFDALCIVSAMGLFVVIVADMFKRKTWWGLLGLLTFVPAYLHVVRYYSGNRKVVGSLFFLTTAFPIFHLAGVSLDDRKQVQPFLAAVSRQLSTRCELTGDFRMESAKNTYGVRCSPSHLESVKYKDVDEMVAAYKTAFIDPMTPIARELLGASPAIALKVGIKSPLKAVACYELVAGTVTRSWATGTDEPCAE